MSKHAKVKQWFTGAGELPARELRGIMADVKAIRAKHRSPFGFCTGKLSKGKMPQA